MDILRGYQLGLFGEIDKQVVAAKAEKSALGDEVVDTVERLLPNTTGFGQSGWYKELEAFITAKATDPGSEPVAFPDLEQTLGYLQTLTGGIEGLRTAVPISPDDPINTMLMSSYDYLINYVTAGAAYPSFVLDKIRRVNPGPRTDRLDEPLNILEGLQSPRNGMAPEEGSPKFITSTDMQQIRAHIESINVRSDWRKVLGPEIDQDFAKKSESCFGLLEEADGKYCGSIYTDYNEDDLSIAQVQEVLHPLNWPTCSAFFHGVDVQNPNYVDTGWSRLLEIISPEPDQYLMRTALIFYFGKFDDKDGVYLNYDIDVTKQLDSFIVEVDSGYIILSERTDGKPGVRIRTSKQERVNGLSPTAASALACHMGWGDLARDMLAGTARLVRDGTIPKALLTDFELSPPGPAILATNSAKVVPTSPDSLPVELPGNFRDTVRDTTTLANDLIDRVTGGWGRAVQRWMDGMTREDVAATTKELGDNLNEFAQEVYTTAENDFKGKPRKQNGGA
jgi:hypothetical protein